MSESQFTPSNELERVMMRAANDPSARPEFYRRLLEAELFFVTPTVPQREGPHVVGKDEKVQFVSLPGPNGDFLPMYSSLSLLQEAVKTSGKQYGYVAFKGQDAFEILSKKTMEVLLNPGCACGKQFLPDEIRRLADGSLFASEHRTLREDTKILLGQPAEYPQEMVQILQKLFRKHSKVQAAYLAQMHDPSSGEPPSLLVGLDGDVDSVAADVGIALRNLRMKSVVDCIQIDTGKNEWIDNYFKTQTTPFYQRAGTKPRWKFW